MRIPLSLSFAAANQVGAVWGPNGTIVNALRPASDPARPVNGRVVNVTGFCLMTDTADAPVQIGVYNITDGVFTALYDVQATQVEAGGLVVPAGESIRLDLTDSANDDVVPGIKYIGATTAKITGHIDIEFPGLSGEDALSVANVAIDAAGAGAIQAENRLVLNDEQAAANLLTE